jgi:von Willebrand factor type D domain
MSVSSDQAPPRTGPPLAREIVVPALVGIIISVVTDAIGNAPASLQLVVATALGGVVWWLLRRGAAVPGRTEPAQQGAEAAQPPWSARRGLRVALVIAAALALVGAGIVAGLAIEWRPTALVIGAWLLVVGAVVSLPRLPVTLSTAVMPLAAAAIGSAVGLTVFEAGVVARFELMPPEPPPQTVARQLDTFDQLSYGMRAIGDFPVAESEDERLQVHERWSTAERDGRTEVVVAAVGVRIDDVVTVVDGTHPDEIQVDGEATTIPEGGMSRGGVTLERSGSALRLTSDSLSVDIDTAHNAISRVSIQNLHPDFQGEMRGLLGDWDGDPANDLQLRDGTVIRFEGDPAAVQDVIDGDFADSWRLRPEQGLLG